MLTMNKYPSSIENETAVGQFLHKILPNDQVNKSFLSLNDVMVPVSDIISNFTNINASAHNTAIPVTIVSSRDNNTINVMDKELYFTEGFTIQEQVVIGASATVGILAILAIVLRILMPMCRKKKIVETKTHPQEDLYDAKFTDDSSPSFVPYIHILPPDSDQSQASTLSEWSDSSSNQTKSTYYSSETKATIWKTTSFGNLRGSTLSLPVSLPNDGFVLSRSCSFERLNDSLMTVLSQKSMQFRENGEIKLPGDHDHLYPNICDDTTGSISSVKTTQTTTSFIEKEDIGPLCEQSYNNKYKNDPKDQ